MGRNGSDFWKRAGRATAWVLGGGILVAIVAAASFYLALKIEMRSNQVQVPDLSGLTREEAARAAAPADLVIEVAEERHDPVMASGRVLQQTPPPGSSVRRGRTLRVILSLGGERLRVPSLVGETERKAEIELGQDGLIAGDAARVPFRFAPAGTIVAQVPPSGSPAIPGTRVHRLVSNGPETARWVMPDLTGRPLQKVEAWLDTCGFRKGAVRRIAHAEESPGTVVGQLPLAGYPIRTRDVVELTVAR